MSSSYYLKLYKEEKDKAKKYEKWIKQLQTIRQNAAGGLDDEIRNVNREITELYDDLKSAVKHDQVFASEAYEIGSSTEAGAGSDRYLRGTQSELDEEIRDLSRKKDDAERRSSEYYNRYEQEKRREEEEAKQKMKDALNKFTGLFH